MGRTPIVFSAALAFTVAGCSDSSKLEKRVANLEAQNAALKRDVYGKRSFLDPAIKPRVLRLERRVDGLGLDLVILDRRTWANDKALWTGVAKAQFDVQCGPTPDPNCHVAAGFPGAVYTAGKPRRLFVTPWP